MDFAIFEEMYAMLWEFIYKLAKIFGWDIAPVEE